MKVDSRSWPIVVLVASSRLETSDIAELSSDFAKLFARGQRFAAVVDLTPLRAVPDAAWRKALSDAISEPSFRESQSRLHVGSAIVVPWAPARAALTALSWLWRSPTPQAPVASVPEGIDWCYRELTKAGVAPSLGSEELRRRWSTPPKSA